MADEAFELPGSAITKIVIYSSNGASTEVPVVVNPEDTNSIENIEVETMPDEKIDVETLRKEILGEVAKAIESLKAEVAAKAAETEKLKAEKVKLEKEVEDLNKAAPKGVVATPEKTAWETLSKKAKVEVLRKNFGLGHLLIYGAKKGFMRGEWGPDGPVGNW